MKTIVSRTCYHFNAALCAGMLLLVASGAPAQNLFELDLETGHIYEFTTNGTQSTFYSGIKIPSWLMTFDSAGNLFVVSYNNILKITPDGVTNIFATGIFPRGLACDSAGNLFADDTSSDSIYKFTPSGVESLFVPGLNLPAGLAFNRAGMLFEADQGSSHIYEFAPNGSESIFASNLDYPFGLAFDGAGNLYEGDYLSGHIYKFTTNGTQSTFASGLDGPVGLVFNAAGDLFEADSLSFNIYEFAPDGAQTTFASNLDEPTGLAFQPIPGLALAASNSVPRLTVSMPSPYFSTIIEASTNLVNWTGVYTNTPPFTFADSTAELPYRFYRVQVAQ
jgi:hypothetical protein